MLQNVLKKPQAEIYALRRNYGRNKKGGTYLVIVKPPFASPRIKPIEITDEKAGVLVEKRQLDKKLAERYVDDATKAVLESPNRGALSIHLSEILLIGETGAYPEAAAQVLNHVAKKGALPDEAVATVEASIGALHDAMLYEAVSALVHQYWRENASGKIASLYEQLGESDDCVLRAIYEIAFQKKDVRNGVETLFAAMKKDTPVERHTIVWSFVFGVKSLNNTERLAVMGYVAGLRNAHRNGWVEREERLWANAGRVYGNVELSESDRKMKREYVEYDRLYKKLENKEPRLDKQSLVLSAWI